MPIRCATNNRATHLCGLVEALSLSSSSSDIAAAADFNFNMDPLTVPGAVSHRHAEIAARLDSWATALTELRAVTCSLTLFHPSFPAPPARVNTHRTRRMHSLNWPGHCARCGLRPLPARIAVAPEAPSFMPVLCVSASRAVEQGRAPHGRIPVQGSGDNYELWGQVCYHTSPLQ